MVNRAYKTELEPNNVQRTVLLRHAGCARFTWNWALARRIEEYRTTNKSSNAIMQHRQLNALKKTDFPWMYEVSKCAMQESLRNLDNAFRNFFRRVKQGQKPGFPRFKSKNRGIGGFRLHGSIHANATHVQLPRLGSIKLKERGYIPTSGVKILSASLTERAGRWFVSISCEDNLTAPMNSGASVGVDLGIKQLAILSNGRVFENCRPLGRKLKRLKRLQRQHSRKVKGSSNRRKSAKRLARLHYVIACARKDALHKLTTYLAKNHSQVAVEDLNVSGMAKNRCLAQAISDVGWAEFRRQLEYKCDWYGSKLVVINRFYPSSKTCSSCGYIKESLALSERVFRCGACGCEIDRDLNAARNILVAASSVETLNACGADTAQAPVLKQELNASEAVGIAG